jgi:hypothetical protein
VRNFTELYGLEKSGQRAFREASRGKLKAMMERCLDKMQRKPFLTADRPEKKLTRGGNFLGMWGRDFLVCHCSRFQFEMGLSTQRRRERGDKRREDRFKSA